MANPTASSGTSLDYDVELPPLPHTLVKTAKLVGEEAPEDPISSLKKIVAADPVVAARTLRRVNSVYYGLKRQVGNVEQAIVLLGFEKVYQLILTNSLVKLEDLFSTDSQVRIFRTVMARCIATAALTHQLTQELYLPSAHLAYSAGLLHAIGRVILLYNRPAPYAAIWWDEDEFRPPKLSAESDQFGTHYADLSAHAAAEWELPETLGLAVRFHVRPGRLGSDRVVRGLSLAVRASRDLSDAFVGSGDSENGSVGTGSWPESEALATLAEENDHEVDELTDVLRGEQTRIQEFVSMSLSASQSG